MKNNQQKDTRSRKEKTPEQKRQEVFESLLARTSTCKDATGADLQLTEAEQIAMAMIQKAKQGVASAANFVFDNAYGKVAGSMPVAWEELLRKTINNAPANAEG